MTKKTQKIAKIIEKSFKLDKKASKQVLFFLLYYTQFLRENNIHSLLCTKVHSLLTAKCERKRVSIMRTNDMTVTANDFHELHVSVEDVIEYINDKTVFTAKQLKDKDRCAVYDSNNKKCAEIAYRNKKDSFSCALQCNRFAHERVRETASVISADYKYHNCKNNRNYMTVNSVDAHDMMHFVFETFDSIIDA